MLACLGVLGKWMGVHSCVDGTVSVLMCVSAFLDPQDTCYSNQAAVIKRVEQQTFHTHG